MANYKTMSFDIIFICEHFSTNFTNGLGLNDFMFVLVMNFVYNPY